MILMITFLLDCVVRHESENKMGSYNLAVIFGPCFFRSRQLELADLLNSGKFSRVIYLLLGGFETVFTSEEIVESRKILQELKKSSFLV